MPGPGWGGAGGFQPPIFAGWPGAGGAPYSAPRQSPSFDTWVDLGNTPMEVDGHDFVEDDVFETVTISQFGHVDGSALFRVVLCYGADFFGRFVEVESSGASQAHATVLMSLGFPLRTQAPPSGIVHLCRCRAAQCQQTFGHRPVYHVDMLRWRDPGGIGEAWATNLPVVEEEEAEPEAPEFTDNFDARVAELRQRLMESRRPPSAPHGPRTPGERLADGAARHERNRSRGRRRRRSRSRSQSSDSSVFGAAQPGGRLGAESIRLKAEKEPGALWSRALSEIETYLGQRGVALPSDFRERSRFVTYLTAIFHGAYPQEKIGPRSSRELRTLAEALDSLGTGDLPRTADLLTQRFKAVEESIKKGSWEDSNFLELIQKDAVGLTSAPEKLAAQRGRLLDQKLTGKSGSAAPRG